MEEVVCKYLPEFGNNGKEFITVREILTHTAGLRQFYPFFDMGLRQKDQVMFSTNVYFTTIVIFYDFYDRDAYR